MQDPSVAAGASNASNSNMLCNIALPSTTISHSASNTNNVSLSARALRAPCNWVICWVAGSSASAWDRVTPQLTLFATLSVQAVAGSIKQDWPAAAAAKLQHARRAPRFKQEHLGRPTCRQLHHDLGEHPGYLSIFPGVVAHISSLEVACRAGSCKEAVAAAMTDSHHCCGCCLQA
jgi:hypothetical protein